jgi:1-acyl-sn-glycerol-3-phosphate acyltransferase
MAKAALGRVPFIGWHLMRGGHVLVNRTNPGAGIFKRMQRMARAGASLMVFPEGGRSDDGVVRKFKAGIFLLAIENGLRVVPISLDGSRLVMPTGRFSVHPARVVVTIHPPIATKGLTRDDARTLAAQAQQLCRTDCGREPDHGSGARGHRQAGMVCRGAGDGRRSGSRDGRAASGGRGRDARTRRIG